MIKLSLMEGQVNGSLVERLDMGRKEVWGSVPTEGSMGP